MTIVIILVGVCGSGKTTVGKALAHKLGWPFADGDDYHSPENKQKMIQGIPLTDEDRIPWLSSLHKCICQWIEEDVNGVMACSALKHLYRHILKHGIINRESDPTTRFILVLLKCSPKVLAERLQQREGHFFNSGLLQSQLETFQQPLENEFQLIIDGTRTVEEIVNSVVSLL